MTNGNYAEQIQHLNLLSSEAQIASHANFVKLAEAI